MDNIEQYLVDVPYIGAENISTRLGRGITINPDSWQSLIATAQRVIGHYQNEASSASADVQDVYNVDKAKPLIAAARIASAAIDAARKEAITDPLSDPTESAGEIAALCWLAASSYAAAGNFASAAACVHQLDRNQEFRSTYRRILFAILSPADRGLVLVSEGSSDVEIKLLESLNDFLVTGSPTSYELASDALDETMRTCSSAFDAMLLRSARLALRHQRNLCTVSNLMTQSGLEVSIAQELGRGAPPVLLPAQWKVINSGLLRTRRNSLITLPTSTGKTLLAQLAMLADILESKGVAVFVAPYVAIARQTTDSFRKLTAAISGKVSVVVDSGAVALQRGVLAHILVVTPERLEALLNTTLPIDEIDIAVFDEAHLIENGIRGARLEGLLTRFRLKQASGGRCRILLMSAAMGNISTVRDWLGIESEEHYKGAWRPTARRVALWRQDGTLTWYHGTDPIKPIGATSVSVLGSRKVPPVTNLYATERFDQIRSQSPIAYRNIAYLCDSLREDVAGPALVVCMTRRSTRGVAHALADRLPEVVFGPKLQDLEFTINAEGPHLFGLLRCLRHGVAYHNASLPLQVREGIEAALMGDELSFVASTTTLAEGADLPFRLTFLFEWLQGYGASQRPISGLLFRNIAGRAGRAGRYTEGDTIVFENVLGNVRYTKSRNQESSILNILSADPQLRSPFQDTTGDDLMAVCSAFEASFVGAVAENIESNDLVKAFSENSFSRFSGFVGQLDDVLTDAREAVLANSFGGPIAVAASPLKLTPFGVAVRKTSLSPASARRLLKMLPDIVPLPLDEAVSKLLMECGAFPEQTFHKLRDLANRKKGRRLIVKEADLPMLSYEWRTGASLLDTFKALPSVKRSTTKRFSAWVSGENVPDWDATYDTFIDFMESSFGAFLPMIARAAATLSEFSPDIVYIDWLDVADKFKERSGIDLAEVEEQLAP